MLSLIVAVNLMLVCNSQLQEDELKVDFMNQEKCDKPSKSGDDLSITFMRASPTDTSDPKSVEPPMPSPLEFTIGAGEVIKGWEEALVGKCPGDHMMIMVPAHLNKGGKGAARAVNPSNFDLSFIEIQSVKAKPEPKPKSPSKNSEKIFDELDKDGNGEVTRDELRIYFEVHNELPGPGIPIDMVEHLVNGLMEQEDKNKDGVIHPHELSEDDYHIHDEL